MSLKISITGKEKVASELKRRTDRMNNELAKVVELAAMDIRNYAVKLISTGSRSGRVYREGTRTEHQASDAGEPPKTDSGRLVNSIAFRITGKLKAIAGSIAGDSVVAEYATSLELGTKKMAPRPFLVTSTESARPKFYNRVEAILKRGGGE